MNDPQIVAFAVVAGLRTVAPGADTMLVIRNVMGRGRAAGLQTTVGACCGLFIDATLSALVSDGSKAKVRIRAWLGPGRGVSWALYRDSGARRTRQYSTVRRIA